MILKIVTSSLLVLSVANAAAANIHMKESNASQIPFTNRHVNPSHNFSKITEFTEIPYRNGKAIKSNQNQADLEKKYDDLAAEYAADIKKFKSNDTYTQVVQPSKPTTSDSMKSGLKFEVPEGYRLPTKADITGDWKRFDAPNHIKADFNGDGIEDEAYILPKKGSKAGYGVFVSINKAKAGIQTGRKFQMFKLTDSKDMSAQSFAIELEEPSDVIWESACGKGYWSCAIGEPAEFKIKNPSIMFCYIESACTMYMWDNHILSFREIKFSD